MSEYQNMSKKPNLGGIWQNKSDKGWPIQSVAPKKKLANVSPKFGKSKVISSRRKLPECVEDVVNACDMGAVQRCAKILLISKISEILENVYSIAKFDFDTAENEPSKAIVLYFDVAGFQN